LLRQLARLTRAVPAAGEGALAIAIYADDEDAPQPAAEAGYEGVACVDDAARAFELLCETYVATTDRRVLAWARGLLKFLLWMHDGEGRWVNFIHDWEGSKNVDGRTSAPGVNFWQARALNAMAMAATRLDDGQAAGALENGLRDGFNAPVPPDVRALQMTALCRWREPHPGAADLERLGSAADELILCSSGGVLMNSPDERGIPHLWGHIQEGVLADASRLLVREELLTAARRSAELVFVELIESGFQTAHMQPYGVQSAVFVMDRLAAATGEGRYSRLARQARSWFDTRNPTGLPIYDRSTGRVADGVDDMRVNRHSGAESNVAAGLALLPQVIQLVRDQPAVGPLFGFEDLG